VKLRSALGYEGSWARPVIRLWETRHANGSN